MVEIASGGDLTEERDTASQAVESSPAARLARALESARSKLLERSLRNKLVNTNLTSPRARQIRVVDERSDEVFRLLRSGKGMAFAPSRGRAATSDQGTLLEGGPLLSELDGLSPDEVTKRHQDLWLQTQLTPDALQKRLLSLFYEAQTIEEEQGINVLFLALGFLEWREAKNSEIPRYAPLLLLPIDLTRDGAKDRFRIKLRQEDLFTNVSLQAWLKEQFGLSLPDLPESEDWKPTDYFAAVRQAIGTREHWTVRDDDILAGFFSFSKFLLWRDLAAENWTKPDALLEHPLLTRILLRNIDEPLEDTPLIGDDDRIDEVFTPSELVHVTDADSSQAIAIQEAMAGKSLVIQGPPGTGKSQTITNIIAGAVKRGMRVLFIAEKMAALDVVHDRLVKRGLGALCLELHSRKAAKGQVLDQIQEGMNAPRPPQWSARALEELDETQRYLRAHADRMHASDGADLSAFALIGHISLLKARGTPTPNFTFPAAARWNKREIATAARRADQLGERLALVGIPAQHPWRGLGIATPDRLSQDRLRPLIGELHAHAEALGDAISAAREILSPVATDSLDELPRWAAALQCIACRPTGVDDLLIHTELPTITPALRSYVADGVRLRQLRASLAAQVTGAAWQMEWISVRHNLAAHGGTIFRFLSSDYRRAASTLRGVWVGKFPRENDQRLGTVDQLIEAQTLLARLTAPHESLPAILGRLWEGAESDWDLLGAVCDWVEHAKGFEPGYCLRRAPSLVDPALAASCAAKLDSASGVATQAFADVQAVVRVDERIAFDDAVACSAPYAHFRAVSTRWKNSFERIVEWPPVRDDLRWLNEIGCEVLAHGVYTGQVPAKHVSPILQLAAYEAMWAEAVRKHPEIGNTQGDQLAAAVRRFRHADEDRIRIAADEVAQSHIDGRPTGGAGAVRIVRDEIKKSRNRKPVRKLMDEAGEAIQRFKPVFMMSPLSVAQFLRPGVLEFDLLVIDEASQVRPEDALGAIARCKQIVIVGDDRQLPPTNFFNRAVNDESYDDDDEEMLDGVGAAPVGDVDSILNLCAGGFPERMLRWHYRSEHPALIATSNRNFYKNQLMLPPSVIAATHDGQTGLMFRKVQEGGYERGSTARNEIEAEAVAHAVIEHARKSPELSLGIGTFSMAQRDAIQHRVDLAAAQHPEVDEFIRRHQSHERLFVKNLENIQGDERDVIFISVGYGRDRDGRLTQNFGPVGREGGERRLNVLITRARKRCEVFSSLVAEDIKFDGAGKPGVRALREFLKLAKDGYADIAAPTQRSFDSDFEESVAHAIKALGYDYHPQVGMAGFFIDIGVLDPDTPDRYILGVECDGAAYHSSRYARDRDRLRQQILESRGWRVHRIWSTDWFYRQQHEIEKLRAAIEGALAIERLQADSPAVPVVSHPPSRTGGTIASEGSDHAISSDTETVVVGQLEPADAEIRPDISDQSDSSEPRHLPPYAFASVLAPERHRLQPHQLSAQRLAALVTDIVRVEQPIHEEEVARRLAAAFDLQRAGRLIQEAAVSGLHTARRKKTLTNEGPFWTESPAPPVQPRNRSALSTAEPVRRSQLIAPSEYAAAARAALEANLALSRDDLVVEVARLLGFARTGHDLAAAIHDALATLVNSALDEDHLGRMRLRR